MYVRMVLATWEFTIIKQINELLTGARIFVSGGGPLDMRM